MAPQGAEFRYHSIRDYAKADEKRDFLTVNRIDRLAFVDVKPDANGNWTDLSDTDLSAFLPIADKKTKSVRVASQERSIFRLYSLGISTNRDEWLYDLDKRQLEQKAAFLIAEYDRVKQDTKEFPDTIKWSETLKRRKHAGEKETLDRRLIRRAVYRPFHAVYLYQSPLFIDRPGLSDVLFPPSRENQAICFSDINSRTNYCVLVVDGLADLHFGAAVDGYQQVPRFRYVEGEREDNITDWALEQFRIHYRGKALAMRPITKDGIFHYVYGVLYDPIYREKYAANLRREFPRIPFYADFWQWAEWGEMLIHLHLGFEKTEPWPLTRTDAPDEKVRKAGLLPKVALRADEGAGSIALDSETRLTGIPSDAWKYRLGNRSALEWILDQYRPHEPKDPTIRAKFNTYHFADYKEAVIDLLKRVTRVSVETMKIVEAMREGRRSG